MYSDLRDVRSDVNVTSYGKPMFLGIIRRIGTKHYEIIRPEVLEKIVVIEIFNKKKPQRNSRILFTFFS